MAHDNEAFVRRLVQLFIQTTPPSVRELEEHLAHQRWAALGAAAHHLKSSLDGLHIKSLYSVIRQLEEAATLPRDEQLTAERVGKVRDVVAQVIDQLRRDFSF